MSQPHEQQREHLPQQQRGPSSRRVRPRLVWGGTLVAVLGCCAAAVGGVLLSWTWTLIGGALLALGATAAYRGGIMRDTSSGVRSELAHFIHGEDRQGVSPGDMVTSSRAEATARRVDCRRRRLERAAATTPWRFPVRPTGGALVMVTIVLLVSQWELYPLELPGQSNATRALGCAIVVGIAGMRIIEAGPGHPLTVSIVTTAAAGILLALNGAVADHARTATAAVEMSCGLLCAICAGGLFHRVHRR